MILNASASYTTASTRSQDMGTGQQLWQDSLLHGPREDKEPVGPVLPTVRAARSIRRMCALKSAFDSETEGHIARSGRQGPYRRLPKALTHLKRHRASLVIEPGCDVSSDAVRPSHSAGCGSGLLF